MSLSSYVDYLEKENKKLRSECEKNKNSYSTLFNKKKTEEEYNSYKDIIHKKDLEIVKLERELAVYKVAIYNGKIAFVSPDNIYGYIDCPDFENDMSFHKANCKGFILKNPQMINKEVSFNLGFTHGRFQAINVKISSDLDQTQDDYNIIDNIMESPKTSDNINNTVNEKKGEEEYKINPLFKGCDVWYMNGYNTHHMERQLSIWEHLIDNGFVYTWCGKGSCRSNTKTIVNSKLPDKLKISDKIAWYFPQRGYSSILEVNGRPHLVNDDELSIIKNAFSEDTIEEIKASFKKHSWNVMIIPVKFLAYIDKNDCIVRDDIEWNKDYEWSYGFRGSSVIRPTSSHWLEQVSKMYDYMNKK